MNLQKWASLDLTKKDGSVLSKVRVGLARDVADDRDIDLDLFIVAKDTAGSKKTAYFNNKKAIEGVFLSEDNLTGEGDGDDEFAILDAKITPDGEYFVCVNIYTSWIKFAEVKNPVATIYDDATNDVIASFKCGEGWANNALIVGKLEDRWDSYKFTAMWDYVNGDIQEVTKSL